MKNNKFYIKSEVIKKLKSINFFKLLKIKEIFLNNIIINNNNKVYIYK